MEKRDILGVFLRNGVMLSPEEFDAIDEKNYMQVLKERMSGKSGKVTVITPKTGKLTCEQFIKICGSKYETLKDEILKKTDAVSINKGKKVFSEVTIVGRVKETASKGFVLEDITGETEVVSENSGVCAGDVIGLKGFFKENKFYPDRTIWPDIPLGNVPNPMDARITLTTKVNEGMHGTIVCPDYEADGMNVISGFKKFGIIILPGQQEKFILMAYSPANELPEDAAVKILKKRTLPEAGIVDNALNEIPDIFWIFNNKRNWTKNYRGVLVVSTDGTSYAEYEGGEINFGKIG
jgi:hypothetical protein